MAIHPRFSVNGSVGTVAFIFERSVRDTFMQTVRRALRFFNWDNIVASFIFGLKVCSDMME